MSKNSSLQASPSALASTNMHSAGEASSAAGAGAPTLEYRTVDKSGWGAGPWQSEPDKRQWRDEATGLPCLIVRGPHGSLCGYVGVAPDHPAHGLNYYTSSYGEDDPPLTPLQEAINDIEVHGGLTFAHGCSHSQDPARGICHIPGPGEPDHVWWFGFDCAHCDDYSPACDWRRRDDPVIGLGAVTAWRTTIAYRDLAYVEGQVRSLARQLAALAERGTLPAETYEGMQARSRDSDGVNQ